MTVTTENKKPKAANRRWLKAETLRLYSGFVLMFFLTTHLINHSLGLISLDAMEAGRNIFTGFWRSVPGTILLLAAIVIHLLLTSAKLLSHRSFKRIPPKEIIQILLGLAIPPLMVSHIVGTRIAHEIFDLNDTYTYVLYIVWVTVPVQSLLQSIGLIVAWAHGCLGMHFWLRLKPWYEKAYPTLYSAALVLPILALTGFLVAANEVDHLAQNAQWQAELMQSLNLTEADFIWAYQVRDNGYYGMIAVLGLIFLSRIFWFIHFRKERLVTVNYPEGKKISAPPGTTVLEISHQGGIPHASVCGGRGRCSTCRIRITAGADTLAPPSDKELAVLKRVGATEGTRLACQVPVLADMSVIPLLPDKASHKHSFAKPGYLQGREKDIAILFADLRAFTKFSEAKLPYDVVFVINQYFRHMGEAIEGAGGHLDKFIGDGVMALFGLEDDPEIAAKKALQGAKAMANALEVMNTNLKSDLGEPLRIGIGIHMGHVIIGEMGYGKTTSITAIGDAVNTASRLEAMNKEYTSQLIFSDRIAVEAGFTGPSQKEEVLVRGRKTPLNVHIIDNARELILPD
ncbi:MAG: adenylate/guanylate cyclase domain-containing protein [Sneathiella sp.]|nr:adenylate/guanylate cyclase domain-containing protein [Sneathiella sp.]